MGFRAEGRGVPACGFRVRGVGRRVQVYRERLCPLCRSFLMKTQFADTRYCDFGKEVSGDGIAG